MPIWGCSGGVLVIYIPAAWYSHSCINAAPREFSSSQAYANKMFLELFSDDLSLFSPVSTSMMSVDSKGNWPIHVIRSAVSTPLRWTKAFRLSVLCMLCVGFEPPMQPIRAWCSCLYMPSSASAIMGLWGTCCTSCLSVSCMLCVGFEPPMQPNRAW